MAIDQPDLITGGIEQNNYIELPKAATSESMADKVTSGIKNVLKTALFMEALRNINWSRAYDWYCEMDGVPNPFHRGGVLGLPVKNLSFTIANGTPYSFQTSSVETLQVPRTMGTLGVISLDLLDDEQQTLARFFERWYNQIYNPYKGVLPVTEACKQITIYKQKSTRRNLKRVYYNIDNSVSGNILGYKTPIGKGRLPRTTEGFDFLVFPYADLQYSWGTDANDLNTLTTQLQVVHFINQDFGNPNFSNGITEVFSNTNGNIHDGRSFLDKLSDYI